MALLTKKTLLAVMDAGVLFICLFLTLPCRADPVQNNIIDLKDREKNLQLKKIELEIRELELKNKNNSGLASNFSIYATSATIFIAVIGLIFTSLRQIAERREEHQRRFDERFSKIVEYLGSDTNTDAGVVLLMNFLKPQYKDINSQILALFLSHLNRGRRHTRDVSGLLRKGFEKSLKFELKNTKTLVDLDFSNADLTRVDFSNITTALVGIDLEDAILENANFTRSNLYRATGRSVNLEGAILTYSNLEEVRFRYANLRNAILHEARLVSAKFKNTDARCAQFQKAKLQGAHFEDSRLEGAQFQEANLCDAYFYGATFDNNSLRTIAHNRESLRLNVHFDLSTEDQFKMLKKEAETMGNISAP